MWEKQAGESLINRSVRVRRERRFLGMERLTWEAQTYRPGATLEAETGVNCLHTDTKLGVYHIKRNIYLLFISSLFIVHPQPTLCHTGYSSEHYRHSTSPQGAYSLSGNSDIKHIEMC